MLSDFKQELINKLSATNDERLLQHIKQAIDYFTGERKTSVLDDLSPEDFQELQTLLKEPFGFETQSYEHFKKTTERWRTEES